MMERAGSQFTLFEATRIVARGSQLDATLDALCQHVLSSAGASAAVVYLHDPVSEVLVPAAQAGLDAAALAGHPTIAADDPAELVARVVRERRMLTDVDDVVVTALSGQRTKARSAVGLPLLTADDAGGEDAEGALLAIFTDAMPDLAGPENALPALADLCAVAIRHARLRSALHERADWIGRLANTDPLTGLANQATFERMLELEIARATRQETQLSVVLLDIDGFARINEQAGAQAADDVLRHVAATIADQVRLVDTVARCGPDEFGLIAPGGGGESAGRRVRDAAAQRDAAGQPISVRVGVAIYPSDGSSAAELLDAARAALDEAKRRGRGSIVVANRS